MKIALAVTSTICWYQSIAIIVYEVLPLRFDTEEEK
jgi:hypothetical protein